MDRDRFCLSDADVLELADSALAIEAHYGRPMDMEWAKDGVDGKLYIVQARPETVASQRQTSVLESYVLEGERRAHRRGAEQSARRSPRKRAGDRERGALWQSSDPARFSWRTRPAGLGARDEDRCGDRHQSRRADLSRRDHRPGAGCSGRRRCGDATTAVPSGASVTVSCAEGDTGRVYRGEVGFHVERSDVGDLARPKTKIMINLGNPDLAFKTSLLPNDGVGLARMEFIISESIRAHPLALLHPEKVSEPASRARRLND